MRGKAAEEGAGALRAEVAAGDEAGGGKRVQPETREQEGMPGPVDDGAEDVGGKILPARG